MKKIFYVFVLGAAVMGCQKENVSEVSDAGNSINEQVVEATITEPVTYLADTDFDSWTSIASIEDRFEACNIPESEARSMTDEALMKSVINYPLNYLIFAYNNPEDAVRKVIENSNVHKELVRRAGSADAILDAFASTTVSDMESMRTKDYCNVTYSDEIFLDYFVNPEFIPALESKEASVTLQSIADKKIEARLANEEVYSLRSISPLIAVASDKVVKAVAEKQPMRAAAYTRKTSKTPFGKDIVVYSANSDFSSSERKSIDNTYKRSYPSATFVSSATKKYNCHSYAWFWDSSYNPFWIDAYENGSLQLSKFWTNALFESCSSATGAKRAYYSTGDHSAIVRPDGKFISKWGQAPVMIHDKNYCPYSTSGIQYFKVRSSSMYVNNYHLDGPSPIIVNTSQYYYYEHDWPDHFLTDHTVEVEDMQSTPGKYSLETFGSGCYLTCGQTGAYRVFVRSYYEGQEVAFNSQYIISIGADWR
ncbi:hypothetical protein SAMN06298215_1676 [Bacteroidales bacterium WCE2008]|nr:hypothetical protein SAMN06298215_1676 [Bacteroidales bacterium WCE2008]